MANIGTRFHTMLKGQLFGKDADGRCYYQSRKPNRVGGGELRFERWVIYKRGEDASAVPPEWWNWLHHVEADPIPLDARKPWQLPPQQNPTGTPANYRPPGSQYRSGHRAPTTSDYEAWTPGE